MARNYSSSEGEDRVRRRDRRERERSPDGGYGDRRSGMGREEARERSRRDRVSGEDDDRSSRRDRELEDDGKFKRDVRERERSYRPRADTSSDDEEKPPRRGGRTREGERKGGNSQSLDEDEGSRVKMEKEEEKEVNDDGGERRKRERRYKDRNKSELSSDDDERHKSRWGNRGSDEEEDGLMKRRRDAQKDVNDDFNEKRERERSTKDRGKRDRESRHKDRAREDMLSDQEERICRDNGDPDEENGLKKEKNDTEKVVNNDVNKKRERERNNKDRVKRDRERRHRDKDRVREDTSSDEEIDKERFQTGRRERQRTSRDESMSDEDEEGEIKRDKREKEGADDQVNGRRLKRDRREKHVMSRHESEHRHREFESEDRHHHRDSERHSDKRKDKRHRERYGDDRRDKGRKERKEDDKISSKKEERDDKREEDPKPQKQEVNASDNASVWGRSGGVYIPPFKLARMMKEVQDKSSVEYQRLTWDALRKSINGLVNKVNASNIKNIIPELFAENLIRGRGLFCRSCMKSQMASPGFTDVFSALVSVVNTKFPEVGELLLRRIVLQLKRAYKRNDKPQLLAAVKFIAHLVNQQVAHEIISLELLTVLLENPTDDSVEVAVGFVTECGSILQDLSPKGLHGIFERFRGILHEGEIDKRVQFLIEGLFAIRKAKFQGHPAVRPELDLVEPEDQLTHEISLQEEIDPEIALDIFKPDPDFLENEKKYEELKKSILGDESEEEDGSDAGSEDDEDDEDEESDDEDEAQMKIKDETETNLVNLRRTIYLTIMSSVDFEEAGHKLLKIKLEPGQEMELCIMLLECCSQERTYLRYYGLLGQRFCLINKIYQENFEKCFVQQYSMIHRLETNKLRNVAKFFAHLLGTDALPWHVLAYIRLTEEDTTSSSRIFIKILFQELSEHLGIRLLNERLQDSTMQESFDSIFPKDNPKNTRFAINFFTSIGLGGITESLREYLKNMPRLIMQQQKQASESESEPGSGSESSGSSESDSSGSDSESGTSSSSSDKSDRDDRKRKRRRRD